MGEFLSPHSNNSNNNNNKQALPLLCAGQRGRPAWCTPLLRVQQRCAPLLRGWPLPWQLLGQRRRALDHVWQEADRQRSPRWQCPPFLRAPSSHAQAETSVRQRSLLRQIPRHAAFLGPLHSTAVGAKLDTLMTHFDAISSA